jgi:hypothetical protein
MVRRSGGPTAVTLGPMRPLAIVGLVLLALGGFVLLRGLSFTSQKSVLKVGDFQASMEERRDVPAWVGALAVAGGIVLLVAGARRRG